MEKYSALLAICAGNSPVPGDFPAQRPVTRSFDVFFYLLLNKRLSKQWRGWWFETPSRQLWRHSNTKMATNISRHITNINHSAICVWKENVLLYSSMNNVFTVVLFQRAHGGVMVWRWFVMYNKHAMISGYFWKFRNDFACSTITT